MLLPCGLLKLSNLVEGLFLCYMWSLVTFLGLVLRRRFTCSFGLRLGLVNYYGFNSLTGFPLFLGMPLRLLLTLVTMMMMMKI